MFARAPDSSTRRPRILVSGPDHGGFALWIFTALAVWRAGGRPVRIRPSHPPRDGRFDGLIVSGGADVNPALYTPKGELTRARRAAQAHRRRFGVGQTIVAVMVYALRALFRRRPMTSGLDLARDELEKGLLEIALVEDRPVLGICRGAQLLNVVCGGTLHEDLFSFYTEHQPIRSVFPRKIIELAPTSRLAACLGTTRTRVNALHRQAVAELGDGLHIVATEPSGVIQGIEHRNETFVVGVQWHPELLPQVDAQQAIFRGLVASSHAPGVRRATPDHAPPTRNAAP